MSKTLKRVAPIGEERDREILKDAATYSYKDTEQGSVQAHIFFPQEGKKTGSLRPALIFFHGGFWGVPTPTQFVPHCLHFSSRGAVTLTAETRTESRHGTGAMEAVEDDQSCHKIWHHWCQDF